MPDEADPAVYEHGKMQCVAHLGAEGVEIDEPQWSGDLCLVTGRSTVNGKDAITLVCWREKAGTIRAEKVDGRKFRDSRLQVMMFGADASGMSIELAPRPGLHAEGGFMPVELPIAYMADRGYTTVSAAGDPTKPKT